VEVLAIGGVQHIVAGKQLGPVTSASIHVSTILEPGCRDDLAEFLKYLDVVSRECPSSNDMEQVA
jgi:hypothetical protein